MNAINILVMSEGKMQYLTHFNKILNMGMISKYHSNNRRKAFLQRLQVSYDEEFFHLDNLDWIKKSKRACMWIWLNYCYFNSKSKIESSREHNDRFETIVSVFDTSNEYERKERRKQTQAQCPQKKLFTIEERKQWDINLNDNKYYYFLSEINRLKDDWSKIYKQEDYLSWLEVKDEKLCRWVWEIGLKNNIKDLEKLTDCDLSFIQGLGLINNEERYLLIYGLIDCILGKDSKILFIKKLKKLWLQSERRKNKDLLPQKKSKKIKNEKIQNKPVNEITKSELVQIEEYRDLLTSINKELKKLLELLNNENRNIFPFEGEKAIFVKPWK